MKYSKRSLTLFAVVTCCVSSATVYGQEQPQKEQTRKVMETILSDPLYVKLEPSQLLWQENEYGHIKLPDEVPEHLEGAFWMTKNDVGPLLGSPPQAFSFYSFGQPQFRVVDARHWFTQKECQLRGLEFLKRHFSWFFALGENPIVRTREPNWESTSSKGVWSFSWQQLNEEGLPSAEVEAIVRVPDGRVVGFSALRNTWAEHKVPYRNIAPVVLRLASLNQSIMDVTITSASVFESQWKYSRTHLPKVLFQVNVAGKSKQSGKRALAVVTINADTGEPVWIDARNAKPTPAEVAWRFPHSEVINDPPQAKLEVSPVWSHQKLALISPHQLVEIPLGVPRFPQIILSDPNKGILRHLTQDLEVTPAALYGLPNSSWLSLERRNGWTYCLNTVTGSYRVLGTPARPALTPTVTPDGAWAIISATSNIRRSDSDLFSDNIGMRGLNLQLRARLVLPGSDEHHPIFSPDGKWLYFVSSKAAAGKAVHSLCRIPASLAQVKELTRLKPEQVETVIPTLPGEVARLSVYPSGTKLLLQTDKSIAILDVAARKITPVALPALKDAGLGGIAITKLYDGWAGPNEGEVTFSGQTMDAKKVVRRRIYSCWLNGSNVKSWIPNENQPVPAYKFLESGKTSFDLAKQWALNEIRWEDEQKSIGG